MRNNKLKYIICCIICIFVFFLSGCDDEKDVRLENTETVITNADKFIEKYLVEQENIKSEVYEEIKTEEQTTKMEYIDKKESIYTFKRAEFGEGINHTDELEQKYGNVTQSCICRLFDEEKVICPSERQCAMILGKIWALFGEPDDPTMYEDFYCYTISAEDKEGNVLYLDIYQYSGMPSIGGPIGEEFEAYEIAALELSELIYRTAPVDYEWKGIYKDYDIYMKYYVKNGVAGAEDNFHLLFE